MRILLVDDEQIALQRTEFMIKDLYENVEIIKFRFPGKALEYLSNDEGKIDIAILDINMKKMSGLVLAKNIKEIDKNIPIIFLTGYSEYALDAFKVHASGYIMKPASREELKLEIDHIKDIKSPSQNKKRVRVQTFGNFEVFVDNKPLKFSRNRTKELFAYLVNKRGANVTLREIMAVLWEDSPETTSIQSNLRNLVSDLISSFKSAGIDDIIIKSRGELALNIEIIDCDYYKFINGDIQAINSYCGEYMTQYSWSEFTVEYLNKQIYRF